MKIRVSSRPAGMALILAMIAIFVFSALAAGFALSMKVEARLAQTSDAGQQFLWAGRAGAELACWTLANHPPDPYDSLTQLWAGGPGSQTESNSILRYVPFDHYQIDDNVWVEVRIEDLDRKININTATPDIIQQVFNRMNYGPDVVSVVSDSILDWIDADDMPRAAGAESDYYQGLPMPYYAKNAPIDDIAELRLIKGVTAEMFEGGSSTNYVRSAFEHKLGFGAMTGPPADFGLKDIFTPVSSGRVNINTADVNVLSMLLSGDTNTAAAIVQARTGPDGVDFRSVGDLGRANIPAQAIQQLNSSCSTRSLVYQAHVVVHVGDLPPRDYYATLYLNSPMDIRILNFYWR